MQLRVISLALFSALLGMASIAVGQQPERRERTDPVITDTGRFGDPTSTGRAYQHYKFGIVKKIKEDELILDKTPYGDNQSFKLLSKTKFVRDGEPTNIDRLKVGDQVYVNVKVDKKTGDFIAVNVAWGMVGRKMKGQGTQ
jgi:hypothetical protein